MIVFSLRDSPFAFTDIAGFRCNKEGGDKDSLRPLCAAATHREKDIDTEKETYFLIPLLRFCMMSGASQKKKKRSAVWQITGSLKC